MRSVNQADHQFIARIGFKNRRCRVTVYKGTENICRIFLFTKPLPHRLSPVVNPHDARIVMRARNFRRIKRIAFPVKKKGKIMHEQSKFPERCTVLSADNSLCPGTQLLSVLRAVERSACRFNDQCSKQSVLLVDIGKQMVMEEYCLQLLICKKPLH